MPFTQQGTFTFLHVNQPDNLSSVMSAAQIKSSFDSQASELRTSFNNLVIALGSTIANDSGAKNTGISAISGVTGSNIQDALADLKTQIDTKLGTSGGTMSGDVVVSKAGATAQISASSTADATRVRLVTSATKGFLQSSDPGLTTGKDFEIGGPASTSIPTLTFRATTTSLTGALSVTGNTTLTGTLNGNTVGTINSSANTNKIPNIAVDGIMEIGSTIDFHHAGSTTDYDSRISSIATALRVTKGAYTFDFQSDSGFNAPVLLESGTRLDVKYMGISPTTIQMTDGTNPTRSVIKTKVGDATGWGTYIESGGTMCIGGGESATAVMNDTGLTPSSEVLILSSDQDINLWANCQTYASKVTMQFNRNGNLLLGSEVVASPNVGLNIWSGSTLFDGSTTITPTIPINQCPNGWMLRWENTSGTANLVHTPIYKFQARSSATLYTIPRNTPADVVTDIALKNVVLNGDVSITGAASNVTTGSNQYKKLVAIYVF
jgi:hypothetical protein